MKANTIPLLHSYNNTSCNRFWDGYFNYSGRQWVVMNTKDKKIEAFEIQDPRKCFANALKILLLFTVIVPIIAAIYHFVKICNYRKYHIKLISLEKSEPEKPIKEKIFESKTQLTRQPIEEIAVLVETNLQATVTKKITSPLSAKEAYEYILNSEKNELTNETFKLLSPLEKEQFFSLMLTLTNLTKLNEAERGVFFEHYGRFLKAWQADLLELLPKFNLLPFIFHSTGDCKDILNILIEVAPESTLQDIKSLLQGAGASDKEIIFQKMSALGKKSIIYDQVLVTYIDSGMADDKDPNRFIQLMIDSDDIVSQISSDESAHFFRQFESLFLNGRLREETRLRFIEKFWKNEEIVDYIVEFLKDETHLEQFQKSCLDPKNEKIFNKDPWLNLKKDRRAYILLAHYTNFYSEEETLIWTSILLKMRPKDFNIDEVINSDDYIFFMALEALFQLHLETPYNLKVKDADLEDWSEGLAHITPKQDLKSVLKMLITEFPLKKHSLTTAFVKSLLTDRDESACKEVLKEVLPNLYKYYETNFEEWKKFIALFDSSKKLKCALDCVVQFPDRQKETLLVLFSAGFFDGQKKMKVNLRKEKIEEVYAKKLLKMAPHDTYFVSEVYKLGYEK